VGERRKESMMTGDDDEGWPLTTGGGLVVVFEVYGFERGRLGSLE
jgi:hypothetical protein